MNFDDIVVKDSPGLCRCCLSEGCYKDLGTEYTWMNDTEVYADMLLDCFDIGITQHNDGPNGPKRLICEVCITRLRDACNFKKQVLDSEKKFIDMLGRGEFRHKVLLYQPEMKAESLEISAEETALTDVEYLEDVEFADGDDDEFIKSESTVLATTSDEPTPKPKRGRPKKEHKIEKPSKTVKIAPKAAKGSKRSSHQNSRKDISEDEGVPRKPSKRHAAMRNNVAQVIANSTVIPFRWLISAYRCFYCYDMFTNVSELKAHNVLHDNTEITTAMAKYWENDVYVDVTDTHCNICEGKFKSLTELVDHLISLHHVEYDKGVDHCFKEFIIGDDLFICAICNTKYENFHLLNNHATKEHKNPDDCICYICERSFYKQQLRAHMSYEHGNKIVNCSQCSEQFTVSTIRTHMARAHDRKFQCKLCKETFETHYFRTSHMTTFHKSRAEVVCPHCSRVFYFKSTLKRHVKEVHLREKNVICSICGWTGFKENRLKTHLQRVHIQRSALR